VVPDDRAVAAVRERLAAADIAVTERESGIAVTDPDGIRLRIRAER
jgi:catechol 2,3-dioxygenase